jgi:hypothetical protein
MRKFLLIAMVLFALPTFAQNYNMRLANIFSEDGFESWDYVYSSEKGTNLVCINEVEFVTPANEFIDSIFYDERGNITRLATWQKYWGESPNIPYGEWIYACFVDYEYDENNNRISRKNYNDFYDGYGPQLGGDQRYTYDADGKMTEWVMIFMDIEFQKVIFEYNEEGYKTAETMQAYSFETYNMENQTLIEYEYDDNNNMIRSNEFFWEAENWVLKTSKVYEYDEFGNCLQMEHVTPAGTVQERRVYTYDTSISADNVFYYSNPEDDYPQLPAAKNNLLRTFAYWAQNDSQELVFVTTYVMDYEAVDNDDAVEEVAFASNVYPNPAQDFVTVESSDADYVEVVDVYGRVMFSSEMNETVKVDMSEFASGIYFVKLQANGATSVQKIMKK